MTTIKLVFPWGRYYAHPWGLNPSRLREPEWPPSPWRLLRAIVSAWFKAHPGQPPNGQCRALVESLARELPAIGFGRVSFGQTVHWQPNYGDARKEDKGKASYKPVRHENHFAAVHGPVFFHWPKLDLPDAERRTLAELLANLTYFGRAESLCHAELSDCLPGDGDIGWCLPTEGRKIAADCRDVFCPNPADFEFEDLWMRRKDRGRHDPNNAPPHFVQSLLDSDMKADGAVWRSYKMPNDWPTDRLVRTPRTSRPVVKRLPYQGPRLARYLCFSLQCRVPIPPKFVVPLSEKFRAAANSHLCRTYGDGVTSFALFGHEKPPDVQGDHQHAFYLPMNKRLLAENAVETQDNGLRYLHIWCPYGFTQPEIETLMRVQRLDWGSGRYPVRPVLIALSKDAPADAPFSTGQKAARIWRSATPFVPPRYFFRRAGRKVTLKESDRPELQLAECLRAAGVTVPGEIRRYPLVAGTMQHDKPRWEIVRAQLGEEAASEASLVSVSVHSTGNSKHRSMEQRVGLFFEIEFEAPVSLPMPALGHSAHFGLGLFLPADG